MLKDNCNLLSISTLSISDSVPLGNSSFSSESLSSLSSVSFINVNTYIHLACLPGSTVFTVTLSVSNSETVSSFSAEPIDLSNIPEEYHKFQDIFSKTKAGNLALHCSYDLKINLEENAQPPLRRMYLLLKIELQALRIFLNENI